MRVLRGIPCPFCGDKEQQVYEDGGGVGQRWRVECTKSKCLAVGPHRSTYALAVKAWKGVGPRAMKARRSSCAKEPT